MKVLCQNNTQYELLNYSSTQASDTTKVYTRDSTACRHLCVPHFVSRADPINSKKHHKIVQYII